MWIGAREEIFGPVAVFIIFSSEDQVLEWASDSNFGLAASIWTKNVPKGIKFANLIQSGTVWIN
jgi:acyl-CoA reductase-like NAD-dependent aldehyde dehydrogenase